MKIFMTYLTTSHLLQLSALNGDKTTEKALVFRRVSSAAPWQVEGKL